MSLEQFISTYGYAAIAIGALIEGETVLVLGGLAAYRGYLELPWVLASAFGGTLLGDQLYFYIGRARGQSFLEKRPKWKSKSEKVYLLLNKYQVLLIFGFRFLYGLRTVAPMVLGASRIPPFRFLVWNLLGAFTWTMTIGIMGYILGHALEVIIGDVKRYESWLFIGLAALGVIVRTVYFFSKK